MMYLGSDGIFVGSGIFKSKDPEKLAKKIVEATTHFDRYEFLRDSARDFGEPMQGITEIPPGQIMQNRGEKNI